MNTSVSVRQQSLFDTYQEYFIRASWPLVFIRPVEIGLYAAFCPSLRRPILDFGCGDGVFATRCFSQSLDWGVDVNRRAVRQAVDARAYCRAARLEEGRLPFAEGYFSSIISNCVLEHVIDLSGTLDELFRVLKPGGLLAVTVVTARFGDQFTVPSVLGPRSRVAGWYLKAFNRLSVHRHSLSAKGWKQAFYQAGFSLETIRGYLKRPCQLRLFELMHFLGSPSVLYHAVTGRWVCSARFRCLLLRVLLRLRWLVTAPEDLATSVSSSPYFFCLLRKPKAGAASLRK